MAKRIPNEHLFYLWSQMNQLGPKDSERSILIKNCADNFNVSVSSVYRQLKNLSPIEKRRKDYGFSRNLSDQELKKYCEIIAALKLKTSNLKGTHLSTLECIVTLEDHGVEVNEEHIFAPKGLLKRSTVDRYLKEFGLNHAVLHGYEIPCVRFEADESNQCWQFDFTPSDLSYLPGSDTKLYLGVVIDDKSRLMYAEYFEVSGEDAVTALTFLFNAMKQKNELKFTNTLRGIPQNIYADNGSFSKSKLFNRALEALGVNLLKHLPKGHGGLRTTARSKGKVERVNRTIKTTFETKFHLHQPQNLEQINEWLANFLYSYNNGSSSTTKSKSHYEYWKANLPEEGFKEMCSWEKFSQIARQPEARKVSSSGCVLLYGVSYQLSHEFAGLEVELLIGAFDSSLYIEHKGSKYGPFYPEKAPIPFLTYKQPEKTTQQKKAESIKSLSSKLSVPSSLMTRLNITDHHEVEPKSQPYSEDRIIFDNVIQAKQFISSYLGKPLSELTSHHFNYINEIVSETLDQEKTISKLNQYYKLEVHNFDNKKEA